MRLFIFFGFSLILTSFIQANDIAEDIVDEWDEKEIAIQEQANSDDHEGSFIVDKKPAKRSRPVKKISQQKKIAKKKISPKKQPWKESTPITRPILYRYIYVNPRAEKLKAEARKKQQAKKKDASQETK